MYILVIVVDCSTQNFFRDTINHTKSKKNSVTTEFGFYFVDLSSTIV